MKLKLFLNGNEINVEEVEIRLKTTDLQQPDQPQSEPSQPSQPTQPPVSGDGSSEAKAIYLNNPIPGYEGLKWGYNRNWSKEFLISKGSTVYFLVDPYEIIKQEINKTLRFNVFNYEQTTNIKSEFIVINKVTGQRTTSTFSGVQTYKERKFSKDEKYLIKCTENGTKNQYISVWWERLSF